MNLEGNRTKKVYELPIEGIQIEDGFNVRQNYGDMEDLEQSILNNGLLELVSVRQEKSKTGPITYLTNGHRRLRAIQNLINKGHKTFADGKPLDKLYCQIEPSDRSRQDILASQILHNDGLPFSALEQGLLMKKMKEEADLHGEKISNREIAMKTGRREAEVSNFLILANTPPEIHEMLRDGLVKANTVLDVTRREKNPAKQIEILRESIEQKKSESGSENARVTAQDVLATMIDKGTVKREPSMKSRLRSLFDDKIAVAGKKSKSVSIVETILLFLDKKATEDDILAAMGIESNKTDSEM